MDQSYFKHFILDKDQMKSLLSSSNVTQLTRSRIQFMDGDKGLVGPATIIEVNSDMFIVAVHPSIVHQVQHLLKDGKSTHRNLNHFKLISKTDVSLRHVYSVLQPLSTGDELDTLRAADFDLLNEEQAICINVDRAKLEGGFRMNERIFREQLASTPVETNLD